MPTKTDHRPWAAWPDGQVRGFEGDLPGHNSRSNITPAPSAVRAFLKAHDRTGAAAGRIGSPRGGQAVRKYTGGQQPRRRSGAVGFAGCAQQWLDADPIAGHAAARAASARARAATP